MSRVELSQIDKARRKGAFSLPKNTAMEMRAIVGTCLRYACHESRDVTRRIDVSNCCHSLLKEYDNSELGLPLQID